MSSLVTVKTVPSSVVCENHMTLPSLKDAMPSAAPTMAMRRATSVEFDDFCKKDDMLFLRLGQGTRGSMASRDIVRDYLCFPGMPEEFAGTGGGEADSRSIAETEYGGGSSDSVRLPNSVRMFPSLSPEPMDGHQDGPQHHEREEQLGSSQRDVYDISPPPGYKRLKRVRVPSLGTDENMTVTAAMKQLLFPQESHISRLQRSRRRQIPVSKRHSAALSCHHANLNKLLLMGDGFSGDETRPQKKPKLGRTARAAPRMRNKIAKRSRKTSDSSGSNKSTSLFQHSLNNPPERRKRGKGDRPLSILGSLDVVSLSQEDREADKMAAKAAARASAKSKDIARHVIPLRPMAEPTTKKQQGPMSLDLDEPDLPEDAVHELEAGADDLDIGEIVFDVVDEADGIAEVDCPSEAATTCTLLPSLRGH